MTTARALVADRVRIPFRRPFATASGMWVERDAWIIRLFDADGRVGLGEAVLASEPGEVADTILTALDPRGGRERDHDRPADRWPSSRGTARPAGR